MLNKLRCSVLMTASLFMAGTLYGHVPHDIIRALGISPEYESDGLVFASADQFGVCILRSTDHGETFSETHAGLETRAFATGMTFSPDFKNDGVVYLVTDQGYYRSNDRGINWKRQPHLREQSILSIWLEDDDSKTNDAYFLTKKGLYLSKDDGASLETLRTFEASATIGRIYGKSNKLYVHTVYYDNPPFVNGQDVIAYKRGQVFVYDLAGKTWRRLNRSLSSSLVADFHMDVKPTHSTMIVSLTDGQIMVSNDDGATWAPKHQLKSDFASKVRISPNLNGFVDVSKAEQLFREANFPYAVGVILLKHPWEFVEGETLPDIFHPDYAQLIQSRAAEVCMRHKDDPLCMGYYYGFGAFNSSDEWVGHHLSLPEGSPGRVALVSLLIERYAGDVAKFNRVYGTSLKEMADLYSKVDLKYGEPGWNNEFNKRHFSEVKETLNPEQFADFEAIVSLMCTNLYRTAHQSIRRWDQNHLIFGSFIKEWALSEDSWKKAAPFVDTIAPQHFDRDISVNGLADATHLPIILSDEYFGFLYPGKPFGYAGVTSHQGRKEIYQANLRRHFKDPQVIGVTYCAGMYDNSGKSLERGEQSGFYSIDGRPREALIKAVTEMNLAVYEQTPKPASPEELRTLTTDLFNKWDEHRLQKQGRLW